MSNELQLSADESSNLQDFTTNALLFDYGMIEKMNQLAHLMASSKIAVPQHFRGSPGDCLAVVMQSAQWGMNPFAVAQKCFNIGGTLGYEAQLVTAVINTRAPIKERLQYEWFGPWEKVVGNVKDVPSKKNPGETYRKLATTIEDEKGCGVKVWTTLKGESEPRVLELMLVQAGVRNSTLWADDPKQQLAYLASKRWSRLHCPDVILGVYTPDEIQELDVTPADQQRPSQPGTRAQTAKERAAAKAASIESTARVVEQPTQIIPSADEWLATIQRAKTPEVLAEAKADLEKIGNSFSDDDWDLIAKALRLKKQQLSTPQQENEPQDDLLGGVTQ